MSFISRFSPVRAYRDLRFFLASREPYELGFLVLAMFITGVVIWMFARDSHVEPVYRPNIIYVQQWRADRTDTQIRAQQVIDEAARQERLAAEKVEKDKVRAQYQRLDNQLDKWGL
jgi:hypothetical protein